MKFTSGPCANRTGLPTLEVSILVFAGQLKHGEASSHLSTQFKKQRRYSLRHLIKASSFYAGHWLRYQFSAYLLLVLSRSYFLPNKLQSKAKESNLPLAKDLLALAKGATLDYGGWKLPDSCSRLKLCLSYSSAHY